jgi:hypothetical protein
VQQILWAEIFLKAAVGMALIIAPLTLIAIVGMARPDTGFWPRLLGGVSLGIAVGVWIANAFPEAHGAIGPAGLIPINLLAASALLGPLALNAAAPTRRGKLFIAASALLLLALAFLEIAHV